MKYLALFLLIIMSAATVAEAGTFTCTVCHSKNPKMRRMHEALGYKDCFKCHGPGKSPGEPMTRRTLDPLCRDCHAK